MKNINIINPNEKTYLSLSEVAKILKTSKPNVSQLKIWRENAKKLPIFAQINEATFFEIGTKKMIARSVIMSYKRGLKTKKLNRVKSKS